jgi:co-chaperonin GroES (HSP10)
MRDGAKSTETSPLMTDLLPMEFNVIVELDPTVETTAGGIILPGQKVERNRIEEVEGVLSAASPLAFGYEDWPEGSYKPRVGDRVLFARYAGTLQERDGKWVRIIKDREIVAVVMDQPALAAAA